MLLLKRITANLIDFLLFAITALSIDWILQKLQLEDFTSLIPYSIPFSFVCSIVFPILIFSKTLGEKIIRIGYKIQVGRILWLDLFIKYFILFILFFPVFSNFLSFLVRILTIYTYINISIYFIFRLNVALICTNFICIIFSLGKQSLIDRIMGIQFETNQKAGIYLSDLSVAYFFSVIMFIGTGIEQRIRNKFDLTEVVSKMYNTSNQIYFPLEIFDKYSELGKIFYRSENTNSIITKSDTNSFFYSQFLPQRQIEVMIKDDLIYDSHKRRELCEKLIYQCYRNIDLQEIDHKVMQTKIILVNVKNYTPYLAIFSFYTYYFDDLQPQLSIYGGYNGDSLYVYYQQTRLNFADSILRFLSSDLRLPINTVKPYIESGRINELLSQFPKSHFDSLYAINLTSKIDKRLMTIPPIPFDSVKRSGYLMFTYPQVSIPIFANFIFDDRALNKAIDLRDRLFNFY